MKKVVTIPIKLLPHQYEFIEQKQNSILVGGFGSGKSDAGVVKTILKLMELKKRVAYYLPTYPLIRDISYDKFAEWFEKFDIQYRLNKQEKIFYTPYGEVILRSMQNPELIVGYEVAYSLIDEADLLPYDKMKVAYNKILSRNRAVEGAVVDMVSTPEGFGFLYEKATSGDFKVIMAKTTDNIFLPKSYIEELKKQYPEKLLKAYLNGEFVNFNSEQVYYAYDRLKHRSDEKVVKGDIVYAGQDFNIGACISILFVERRGVYHAVKEIVSKNTESVAKKLKRMYPTHTIVMFPDSAGNNKSTNASKTDIQILKEHGLQVKTFKKNPLIKDRVNSVNNTFEKGRLMINDKACPKLAEALERQAYDGDEPEKGTEHPSFDDYTDALGYFIYRKLPIKRPRVFNQTVTYA